MDYCGQEKQLIKKSAVCNYLSICTTCIINCYICRLAYALYLTLQKKNFKAGGITHMHTLIPLKHRAQLMSWHFYYIKRFIVFCAYLNTTIQKFGKIFNVSVKNDLMLISID